MLVGVLSHPDYGKKLEGRHVDIFLINSCILFRKASSILTDRCGQAYCKLLYLLFFNLHWIKESTVVQNAWGGESRLHCKCWMRKHESTSFGLYWYLVSIDASFHSSLISYVLSIQNVDITVLKNVDTEMQVDHCWATAMCVIKQREA